jgi:7,8-dihydropterin-6-yl-methyl-4-(beta-D-ribofuranosyl)aminobenzene 5'-phosphate synthase
MAEGMPAITTVDRLTIWALTDNTYDANRPDAAIAKRFRAGPGRLVHAEHGLSLLAEAVVGGRAASCLFDFATDPAGVLGNAALLGVDPGAASAFALSHGHWDHSLGAVELLTRSRGRLAAGTPFFVGEEAFAHRYATRPGQTTPTDLGRLRREALEHLGLAVREVRTPTEIVPGGYLTGNIARVTSYEQVAPSYLVERGGRLEHDTFSGEQALFFPVKGKGLVVVSGCAHAGIVNTVMQARAASGVEKVHAVLGGFHLTGAHPDVIRQTVADLQALEPDFVVPAHCSGFETLVAFARAMPEQLVLCSAGTRFEFGA